MVFLGSILVVCVGYGDVVEGYAVKAGADYGCFCVVVTWRERRDGESAAVSEGDIVGFVRLAGVAGCVSDYANCSWTIDGWNLFGV